MPTAREQSITATQFAVLQSVQARPVRATAYLVVELPDHAAYPDGKDAIVKRATELAAAGKLPVRWIDPNLPPEVPTDADDDDVEGFE